MDRTTWTDERLNDFARRLDVGFERVDVDITRLERTMETRFAAVDRRFDSLDSTMDARFAAVDQRFNALENRISWFGGGLILTMLAAILSNAL